ncbi:MAG: ClpXP protease specificity-enhancing factor [Gammaproteobacteria bacterium]|nr:ClpXP protease specificity-enhancing factor [Gammaproteobacteria bacterium]
MSSSKPYLINALYQWIVDNKCTPYVLVDAYRPGVEVPQEFVKEGQIVLNVAPQAVVQLTIDNQGMRFNARFGGIPMDVYAPLSAILGIYAKENGQGMMFDAGQGPSPDEDPPRGPKLVARQDKSSPADSKPSLRIVK